MDATSKKASLVAIAVQVILTGMSVVSKAAFNEGMSTFVFVFYRQAAGSVLMLPLALLLHRKNARSVPFSWLLKLFFCALIGNTLSTSLYNLSLKFTSATVASATNNSVPVITFCFALIMRMEVVNLRSAAGIAKLTGAGLCLAGVLFIAFYRGLALSPVSHHRAFAAHASGGHANHPSKAIWIEGAFLMVLANMAWAVSIVWQAALLKECPNKMLVATALTVFSAAQSFVVAAVAERDFSRWRLRPDVSLLAILYCGFFVSGASYYLQAWCVEIKGPVFFAFWSPLCFVLTIFCSSFFLGEIVHLGSIVGGVLLVCGLYSVLWGKSKESKLVPSNEANMSGWEQDEEGNNKSGNYNLEQSTSATAGELV
ncbi:hypothetical protein EJB05_44771 [Eragrostis curvula]|uniref:WAT1-related protein n=1 Tax=Eragrostis curvula TaxID=38414 RepID=A0A5J9TIM4_9POAL|nr:hypothetical protein EJB05_44771 [Eragrostis curvula]